MDGGGWRPFYRAEGEVSVWFEGHATAFCWNYRDHEEALEVVGAQEVYFYGQYNNERYPEEQKIPDLRFLEGKDVRFGFSRPPVPFEPTSPRADGKPMLIVGDVVQVLYRENG